MKSLIKLIGVVFTLTMLFLSVTSVSGTDKKKVTVTFWKASHGDKDEDWRVILDKFEQKNPGVKVESLLHPWEGWDERYGAAFAAGEPPDVSYMPDEFWPKFAEAGQLAKLDKMFAGELAKMKNEYPKNFWDLCFYKGSQYGVPYLFVAVQLFYNKDLFDAAGIEYPPSSAKDRNYKDWTWEKFIDVAKALTDPSKDQWGYAWSANWRDNNFTYPILWQAGADILDVKKNVNAFNNKAGLAAFQFMYDLVYTYKVVPDDGMNPKFQQVFFEGRAAMCPVESYSIPILRNDYPNINAGSALAPQGPGTNFYSGRGTFGNSGYWVIANSSKSKETALKLVQFINQKDNMDYLMNVVNLFGCRKDFKPPLEKEPLLQIFFEGIPNQVPYPLHPKLRQVHSLIRAEVQSLILKEKAPKQALADAAAAVDALLAE
jgi:ABC-type glycerol-3-phosphate transport system substrate-binding protein